MQLSRALAEAANSFDIVGSDHRIGPLLKVKACCFGVSCWWRYLSCFCSFSWTAIGGISFCAYDPYVSPLCFPIEHEQAVHWQRFHQNEPIYRQALAWQGTREVLVLFCFNFKSFLMSCLDFFVVIFTWLLRILSHASSTSYAISIVV